MPQKAKKKTPVVIATVPTFTSFHHLVVTAMEQAQQQPHAATELAIEWLLARPELIDQFVKPILRHACNDEVRKMQSGTRRAIFARHRQNGHPIEKTVEADEGLETDSPTAAARRRGIITSTLQDRQRLSRIPLMDGTFVGNATRPLLLENANGYFAQAKSMMITRNWFKLLAQGLPDDTKRALEHFGEDGLSRLFDQAKAKAVA